MAQNAFVRLKLELRKTRSAYFTAQATISRLQTPIQQVHLSVCIFLVSFLIKYCLSRESTLLGSHLVKEEEEELRVICSTSKLLLDGMKGASLSLSTNLTMMNSNNSSCRKEVKSSRRVIVRKDRDIPLIHHLLLIPRWSLKEAVSTIWR